MIKFNLKFIIGIIMTLLIVGVTSLWLLYQYTLITNSAISDTKLEIASFIQNKSKDLIKAEDFNNQDKENQHQAFSNLFYAIQTPDLIRMKVWDKNYKIIWSDLPALIGQIFPDNLEVKEALKGDVEMDFDKTKFEHLSERQYLHVSEIYIPIKDLNNNVIGVIEVYKPSHEIFDKINNSFLKYLIPSIAAALISEAVLILLLRLNKK